MNKILFISFFTILFSELAIADSPETDEDKTSESESPEDRKKRDTEDETNESPEDTREKRQADDDDLGADFDANDETAEHDIDRNNAEDPDETGETVKGESPEDRKKRSDEQINETAEHKSKK